MQDSHNPEANEWVLSWLRRLEKGARVLDFASGGGRHALSADALGLTVEAWDRDADALAGLSGRSAGRIRTVICDLEAQPWPVPERKFDALVVTNYLFRPRMAFLPGLLAPSGLLVFQTFARGHETLGRPRRPDFLLQPGELYERMSLCGLHVLAYEDSVVCSPDGVPEARIQRVAALAPAAGGVTPGALAAWPAKIR